MIQQSTENGNTQVALNAGFVAAIREMQISKLLHDKHQEGYNKLKKKLQKAGFKGTIKRN